jgi:hypothetical protein
MEFGNELFHSHPRSAELLFKFPEILQSGEFVFLEKYI